MQKLTLSELVPSLDLCQQLKDAGFPQDTALSYFKNPRDTFGIVMVTMSTGQHCAAPTAEEILKEFPSADIRCDRITLWGPTCDESDWDIRYGKVDGVSDSLVNAAAQAYLWWKKEVAG